MLSTLTGVTSLVLPMRENYARQSSLRPSVGFENAGLYAAARMFPRSCGGFMENSFALFNFLFKVALKGLKPLV